jgi:hypothetical protein
MNKKEMKGSFLLFAFADTFDTLEDRDIQSTSVSLFSYAFPFSFLFSKVKNNIIKR